MPTSDDFPALELRNMLQIATSALHRQESRGGHIRAARGACSTIHSSSAPSAPMIAGAMGQIVSSRSRVMARTEKLTSSY